MVSILSRVVPGSSLTMFLSSPTIVLINEDLPAFGLPTTAKDGNSLLISLWSSTKSLTSSSNSSPVPLPFIADIENKFSKPKS